VFGGRPIGKGLNMTNEDPTDRKTEEQPATQGGRTAPQDVDNPSGRTTPAATGDTDTSRLHNAEEDRERTIAK
jgi:hypothetical protein